MNKHLVDVQRSLDYMFFVMLMIMGMMLTRFSAMIIVGSLIPDSVEVTHAYGIEIPERDFSTTEACLAVFNDAIEYHGNGCFLMRCDNKRTAAWFSIVGLSADSATRSSNRAPGTEFIAFRSLVQLGRKTQIYTRCTNKTWIKLGKSEIDALVIISRDAHGEDRVVVSHSPQFTARHMEMALLAKIAAFATPPPPPQIQQQ